MTIDEMLAREGIRDAIARYTIAGDSRDRELFLSAFAEDAVFEFAGFPPVPGFRLAGRAEIDPASRWRRYAELEAGARGSSFIRHNLTTCRIELTGAATAKARSYFIVFTDIGPDHSGTYDDVLVEQDGRWRISHRKISLDWRSPESLFPVLEKPKP